MTSKIPGRMSIAVSSIWSKSLRSQTGSPQRPLWMAMKSCRILIPAFCGCSATVPNWASKPVRKSLENNKLHLPGRHYARLTSPPFRALRKASRPGHPAVSPEGFHLSPLATKSCNPSGMGRERGTRGPVVALR